MNKGILGVGILAIGIGTYFYLSGTEEVRIVKPKIVEKVDLNKTEVKKQKKINKKEVKKKTGPKIVKGYLLPPEPDKVLNNSTLLGIDSNNNMLRDDVEIWIVKQPWSHERIASSLQFARGFQITMNEGMGSYKRRSNFFDISNYVMRNVLKSENKNCDLGCIIDNSHLIRKKVFNTKERWEAYMEYDRSFSGTIVKSFPLMGVASVKQADYHMKHNDLSTYEFNGKERYFSDELLPLYNESGLIVGYWDFSKNEGVELEGKWEDTFCQINFGIQKNNYECSQRERKIKEDVRINGLKR